jgi:hypothetical protein
MLQTERKMISHTAYGESTEAVNDNVVTSHGYLRVRRRKQTRKMYVGVKFYGHMLNDEHELGSETLLRTFGISWQDVLPAAWELIPYSFLIDYFTNIGEVISGFSHGRAGLGWVSRGIAKACITGWNDVEVEYLNPSNVLKEVVYAQLGAPCFRVSRTITRERTYTGSMIPSFEWQIPGMGLKWLNLAALVAASAEAKQAFRRP